MGIIKRIVFSIFSIILSLLSAAVTKIPKPDFSIPVEEAGFYNYRNFGGSTSFSNALGEEIIRCIREKDKKGLNDLFCPLARDTEYLNKQIDSMFDYLEKNKLEIKGDETWRSPAEHGTTGGKRVYKVKFIAGDFNGDCYINGKKYDLGFSVYTMLDGYREYEGILVLDFSDDSFELSNDELNRRSDIISKGKKGHKKSSIGVHIADFDRNKLEYYDVLPKELYEDEKYKYSIYDLEDERDKW